MRHFLTAFLIFCACSALVHTRANAAPTIPTALAQVTAFRGHVVYSIHPADDRSQAVEGSLVVTPTGWTLEEAKPGVLLHLSGAQSWIRSGDTTDVFDDPFDVDALQNSWAALLGSAAGASLQPSAAGSSWTTSFKARIYLNAEQTDVTGVVDDKAADQVSFAYSDWQTVNGLRLPNSIVRLRGGVSDAAFVVDRYEVTWVHSNPSDVAVQNRPAGSAAKTDISPRQIASPAPGTWLRFSFLFALLAACLGFVAWLYRDALTDRLANKLVRDPRAWRYEGTDYFVSPDGVLFFSGNPYRVGPNFYNRAVTVQSSPLFIRISAKEVPRVLVLARKFAFAKRNGAFSKRYARGFSLVEAMAATLLLATVVVGSVVPALIVLARADRLAAEHEAAVQIARNALADEEAMLAYGSSITDGSAVSHIDGMGVTTTVATAAPGLYSVSVMVADSSGSILARLVTEVGPPVLPPGGPTPGPSSTPGRS